MLVKRVTTLENGQDKSEFIELAYLYIRITKVACEIENIKFTSVYTEVPYDELRSIGAIENNEDVVTLKIILCSLYENYIASVNMVAKNDSLRPYLCKGYNSYRLHEQQNINTMHTQ